MFPYHLTRLRILLSAPSTSLFIRPISLPRDHPTFITPRPSIWAPCFVIVRLPSPSYFSSASVVPLPTPTSTIYFLLRFNTTFVTIVSTSIDSTHALKVVLELTHQHLNLPLEARLKVPRLRSDPSYNNQPDFFCQLEINMSSQASDRLATPIRPWWKDAVIYQIYPASFKDSNNDGLGDIPGIISKLDYIKGLGVDGIWLSPIYESPQKDMGYDISNYEDVYAPYGTLQDAETLIQACHDRNIRIIFDLVINHTSNKHSWFIESSSSKDNSKRDWYIWRPASYDADGNRQPPNNWASWFSGSVWEWDESTQEYYLHLFAKEQPDLNWENPVTREAIYKSAIDFWLKRGVDGFRIDSVTQYSKGITFPDAPVLDPTTFEQPAYNLFCNGPRIHEFLREMNSNVFSDYDIITIGEAQFLSDPTHALRYIQPSDKQLDMLFLFDLLNLGHGKSYKYGGDGGWDLTDFKTIITYMQSFIQGTDGWTTVFFENHDNARSISRFTSDAPKWRERSGKMLAMMSAAMTGTLFLYQGQEIGAINGPKTWSIETDYADIESLNFYNEVKARDPANLPRVTEAIQLLGRDHPRLPMCWDDSAFAGFTERKEGAWMRVHDNYHSINVMKEEANTDSVLHFWRRILKLRKELNNLFVHGSFQSWDLENKKTFCFRKMFDRKQAVVVLNFTDEDLQWTKPEPWITEGTWKLLISNVDIIRESTLTGFEGRIYLVSRE